MAEIYLVEFKGTRREFFYNSYYHALKESDYVIVEAERGEDIGRVSKKVTGSPEFIGAEKPRSILRRAGDEDHVRLEQLRDREQQHKNEVVEMITEHRLPMKVVDIESQYDGNKMTVFFTADHRVDFRGLVKDLASRYRTRIELRQIGVRDEARRLGGYGICGLPQCCSTFIREFAPISTQHARDQNLPLNPSKISGNCGRLLCCLRYEADMYTAAKAKLPNVGMRIQTKHGNGVVVRIDVFNEEAILRDEEGVLFRSSSEDIIKRDAKIDQKIAKEARGPEDISDTAESREELRQLDMDDTE